MRVLLVTADAAQRPMFGYRIKSALQKLGHEVIPFNYRAMQFHRFTLGKAWLSKSLVRVASRARPDSVFVVKGETLLPGTIAAIAKQGIHTSCYTMDDPFGRDNPAANTLRNIPEYNSFFCFDSAYVPELKKVNPHSHYLPCAVDPDLHRPVIPEEQRTEPYTVGFVGSHYPNRQEFLNQLTDLPLYVQGFRWAEKTAGTPLAEKVRREVFNADKREKDLLKTCALFNQTQINLNIHFTHSKNSPNLRTFEIPATSSFELCDDLPDLHHLFRVGKELAIYKNPRDCRQQIRYFLDNPEERKRLARAGYRRVIAEHTFVHRMEQALNDIKHDQKS
jgi:spore maturation protein CgeB